MSQKIHIGKNGPAPCRASKRPCTLGQHYESMEEADKAFDAQQSSENNSLKGVSKKTPVKNEDFIMTVDKYGAKNWKNKKGLAHRTDGPAIEFADGTKMWYQNGKLNRTDGPAVEYANGDKEWYQNDNLHRVDGPAVELADGTKRWLQNGRLHRVDGPSIEDADGTKMWHQNGKEHRVDGPAIEEADGSKMWYQNGKPHRVDGPAIEMEDGTKKWYQNGEHHRTDGPAIEWANGEKEYWVNGARLGEKEFLNQSTQKYNKTEEKKTQQSSAKNTLKGVNKNISVKNEESTMILEKNGNKKWINKNGELHRIDGPARELSNGTKYWYQNGKLNREDGPAIELYNGTKSWYKNGKQHRVDGPATEFPNGDKYWYQNGKLHRTDGPAIDQVHDVQYWVNGKRIDEKEYNQKYFKNEGKDTVTNNTTSNTTNANNRKSKPYDVENLKVGTNVTAVFKDGREVKLSRVEPEGHDYQWQDAKGRRYRSQDITEVL